MGKLETTWIFKAGSAQLPAFWFGIGMAIKKVWVGGVCGIGKEVGVWVWEWVVWDKEKGYACEGRGMS